VTKGSRPRFFVLLAIVFAWSAAKNSEAVLFYASSANYLLMSELGLPWLHFLQVLPITALDALAAWFLFRPSRLGLPVILVDLGYSSVLNIVVAFLGAANLEMARAAYIANREARGLPLHLDRIDTLVSPTFFYTSAAAVVVISLFIAGYLLWQRRYFYAGKPSAVVEPGAA